MAFTRLPATTSCKIAFSGFVTLLKIGCDFADLRFGNHVAETTARHACMAKAL
jgi:hypothetical protein